jgi:hypothetical protein
MTHELERQYFAEGTEAELRAELVRMAGLAITGAVEHERYATACWPDDVRLTEAEARAALPALLTPAERAGVEDTVRGGVDPTPPCSAGPTRSSCLPGGYRPQRPGPADTAGRAVPGAVRRLSSASLPGLAAAVEGSRA